jgi:phosphoenolpyruvate-protein kinase (PTS system EI component)
MLEPAVWRLIAQVVKAGTAHGTQVAVCGELAADPRVAPALVGLGVQELSMSPPAIARVKSALHQHALAHWQALAQALLKAETAAEMQEIIQSFA